MGKQFNFEQGMGAIQNECDAIFQEVHSTIQKSIQQAKNEILGTYPWEHLRDYLAYCYGQMAENLEGQIIAQCKQWSDGDGGFMAFARGTGNSEEAIRYAHSADTLVETKIRECFKDLGTLVAEELGSLKNEKPIFNPEAVTKLHEMFTTVANKLQGDLGTATTRIRGRAEENNFVTPLELAVQIVYNTSVSWYRALDASVNDFAQDAYQLLDKQTGDSRTAATNAGNQAGNATPELKKYSGQA